MTAASAVGRRQPPLADRIATRALALSVDPPISFDSATDALLRLWRGNRELLERALRRLRLRSADCPSPLTALATTLLQVTLDQLEDGVATASPQRRTS